MMTNLKDVKYVEDLTKEYKFEHLLFYLLKFQVGENTEIEDVDGFTKLYVEQVDIGNKIQVFGGFGEIYG